MWKLFSLKSNCAITKMIDRKNNFLPPCVLIVWLLQNIWKRQSTKVRTLQDALLFIAETRRHITLCCSVTIFFQNKFLWTSCHNCMVEIVCLCVCMSDNAIQINQSIRIKTFFSFVANRLLIEIKSIFSEWWWSIVRES